MSDGLDRDPSTADPWADVLGPGADPTPAGPPTRGWAKQRSCSRCGADILVARVDTDRRPIDVRLDLVTVRLVHTRYLRLEPTPLALPDGEVGSSYRVHRAGAWWERLPSYVGARVDAVVVGTRRVQTLYLARHPDEPGSLDGWPIHRCGESER